MTTEAANGYAVELQDATKSFGRAIAVGDLTLRVPRGKALGLIGPNGAGKTTTLKMLMGLLPSDWGAVRVLGQDPLEHPLAVREAVGYVPEQNCVHRWMRVQEAAAFCGAVYAGWNDKLVAELIKLFDLDPGKKVGALSKGMQAKLSLVLALGHDPDVLLLDEPMGGLDPLTRDEFLDGVLREVCDRERTIVFSSHLLSDVQRIADRIAILNEGRLLVEDGVESLLSRTKRVRAVLGNGRVPGTRPEGAIYHEVRGREWLVTLGDFSNEAVTRLRSAEEVESVEVFDLGLEDIFKDYIRGWRSAR